MLLDLGADYRYCEPKNNYSCLHFACLSGNGDICQMLLKLGVDSQIANKINRTASQLAAFVANYNCVAIIHSFIPTSIIEQLTNSHQIVESVQKFLINPNLNPVRIYLNLTNDVQLFNSIENVREILHNLQKDENQNRFSFKEESIFKFFYFSQLFSLVTKVQNDHVLENIHRVVRKFLKHDQFFVNFLKECLKRYYTDKRSAFVKQMMSYMVSEELKNDPLAVLNISIFGRDKPLASSGDTAANKECSCCSNIVCSLKKCSRCKEVFYCDKQCQVLHWSVHRTFCIPVIKK